MNEAYFDDGIKTAGEVSRNAQAFNAKLNKFLSAVAQSSFNYANRFTTNNKKEYKFTLDNFTVHSYEGFSNGRYLLVKHMKKKILIIKYSFRYGFDLDKIVLLDSDKLDYLKVLLDTMLARIEALTLELD